MITRHVSAALTASAVTLALFFIMPALIALQPMKVGEPRDPMSLVFTRLVEDSPLDTRDPPPDFSELRERSEPLPPRNLPAAGTQTVGVPPSVPAPEPSTPGLTGFHQDGPLVAMVRVEPAYPIRASEQGLEGYVIVAFDVTANGTVSNARVVESSHRIFERPALDAAMKFRFRPRIAAGVPQTSYGLQNVFRFRMERG